MICSDHTVLSGVHRPSLTGWAALWYVLITLPCPVRCSQAEFDRLGCSVLVVSFGGREGALRWLADTGCQFPLLLDPERRLYKAMGLGNGSIAKVCTY